MPIQLEEDQTLILIDGQYYLKDYIFPPETISFHEKTNRWTSFYSFFSWSILSNRYRSSFFLRGELFIHDRDEDNYNSFARENILGQPIIQSFPSRITTVSNASPSETKIYQSLSEESSDIWEVDYIETEEGQVTRVPEQAFTKGNDFNFQPGHGTLENVHFARIPMDENSPGGIINGDRIRSHSVLARFSYFKNQLVKLFAVNFNVSKSYRND